jgi:acyl-CoA reductase-like NAD-dependent aldehyde dehydrogenase
MDKANNGHEIPRTRGLWSSLLGAIGVGQASEQPAEMLSEQERDLAAAFTEEQRREYEDAERNCRATIEEIRRDGEHAAQEIFERKQEENLRLMFFAAGALREEQNG